MYRAPEPPRALFIVAANERVLAYRRSDGAVAWAYAFPVERGFLEQQDSSPNQPLALEFMGDRIFVGLPNKVVCLDYASGQVVGQVMLPEPAARPQLLVDGNDVFVMTIASVLCLDPAGNVRWRVPHGLTVGGSPTVGLPGNVRAGDSFGWK
jgi:hypothetical protein